jgi:hypothetical protein
MGVRGIKTVGVPMLFADVATDDFRLAVDGKAANNAERNVLWILDVFALIDRLSYCRVALIARIVSKSLWFNEAHVNLHNIRRINIWFVVAVQIAAIIFVLRVTSV